MGTVTTLMPLWKQAAGARGGLTWIFNDEFTTNDAAPITTPRTCEPGPGTLVIVQPSNQISISGGELVFSSVAEYCGVGNDTNLSATVGNALYCEVSSYGAGTVVEVGFDANVLLNGLLDRLKVRIGNTGALANVDNGFSGAVALGETYSFPMKILLILRGAAGAGAFCVVNGELAWVSELIRAGYKQTIIAHTATPSIDSFRTVSLSDNGYDTWGTQYGLATNRVASPSSGETTTSAANAFYEFTWTVAAAETLEFMIRRIDDTHTWVVRCDQAGSTIKIIEINGGETERASAASTWTDTSTYRIAIRAIDEEIKSFVGQATKNTYSSASYNKTVTGVKISGFAAGSELVCYPHDVASLLPLELV